MILPAIHISHLMVRLSRKENSFTDRGNWHTTMCFVAASTDKKDKYVFHTFCLAASPLPITFFVFTSILYLEHGFPRIYNKKLRIVQYFESTLRQSFFVFIIIFDLPVHPILIGQKGSFLKIVKAPLLLE